MVCSTSLPQRLSAFTRSFFRVNLSSLLVVAAASHALTNDADQPIHIRANNAEIDQDQQLVIYRGEVQVDQGSLRVIADEMRVEYRDQKVVKIIATGAPAYYQQQVEGDDENVRARSSTIIYHTQEERLDLMGNAYLSQEGNEITGDLIKYDIVAGKVDAKSESGGPVRMTLQPAPRTD